MAVTGKVLGVVAASIAKIIGIPKANLASILGNTFPAVDAPPAGYYLWLDAGAVGEEPNDGEDLSVWEDGSGNFYDAEEGTAPSWHASSAIFNNEPYVSFQKVASEYMVAFDMRASIGGVHVFVVAMPVEQGASAAGWVMSGSNQHPILGWDNDGGQNKVDIYSAGGHHRFDDLTITLNSVAYIWEFIANDAGNYLHAALNGVKAASTIAENINTGWFPASYALASQDDDPYVNAGSWQVAEIIFYDDELSAGNRASVLAYLNGKYNIY